VDVRPAEEYYAGRIPGAVSIPLNEFADLPDDVDVVAYCRGAYYVLARDAVRLLTARSRRAARLVDGMLECRLADLPVDATTGTAAWPCRWCSATAAVTACSAPSRCVASLRRSRAPWSI
jgi:rhodanese-related sulfurtransferase